MEVNNMSGSTKVILGVAGAMIAVGATVITTTILKESAKNKKQEKEEEYMITKEMNEFFESIGMI